MAGPLLYLYFLVPFGEFLTPKLQDITTWFIGQGVDILGIPAYIDGYVIEIPQGTFFVAEACAGLRFLIASIAFGCLYALLMYRSPVRRGLFILASIIVPVVANGFRGLGIVVLGYMLNSAQAAAADHIIYGWVFFSFVILLLIVLGLPFRQDDRLYPVTTPAYGPTDQLCHFATFGARPARCLAWVVTVASSPPRWRQRPDDHDGRPAASCRLRSIWDQTASCGIAPAIRSRVHRRSGRSAQSATA